MIAFIILYGLAGALVGVVLNALIDRLPTGANLLRGKIVCAQCGEPLSRLELLPVLGYFIRRGRCRTCGAVVSVRVPAVEVAAVVAFGVLSWQLGPGVRLAIGTLYACLFVLIFVIDLERHLVLNKVIYPAILAAPFLAWGWGLDPRHALIGGVAAFGALLLVAIVYPAGMGLGDVKLGAFVGLIAAWPDVVVALFMTIMAGGIVALGLLLARLRGRKDPIAYATFLVIGAIIALTWGEQIRDWYFG